MAPARINFVAVLFCLLAACSQEQSTVSKARQLVEILRYPDQIDNARNDCLALASTVKAEDKFAEDAGYFGGITPKSPYWSEIKELYESYYQIGCGYLDTAQIVSLLEDNLSRDLSDAELKEILAFYDTAAGKRFRDASYTASQKLSELMSKGYVDQLKEAERQYQAKLNDIVARFRKNPK